MRNFNNSVFMSKKRETYETGSVSWLVLPAAHNRLKNLSIAVNATRHATSILLREVNQK